MAKKQQKGRVTFRRIRGRIVPIRVSDEVAAAKAIGKQSVRTGAAAGAAAAAAGGVGLLFAAGRLQRHSEALTRGGKKLKTATALNKAAKITKFTGKFGAAFLVGSQLLKVDKATRKDEKSRLFNLGSGGSPLQNPARLAVAAAGAFAFGRIGKRFEKFGLRGGRFPFKLKDI